jgi:hypothetical protein
MNLILWRVSLGWAAVVVALMVVWQLLGDRWWPLIFLRLAPAVLFLLPSAVMIPAALGTKQWRTVAFNLGSLLFILLLFVRPGLCVAGRSSADKSFKVLSYNIDAGLEGVDRVIDCIKRINYVWVAHGLKPLRAEVLKEANGSDHRPLLVTMTGT